MGIEFLRTEAETCRTFANVADSADYPEKRIRNVANARTRLRYAVALHERASTDW